MTKFNPILHQMCPASTAIFHQLGLITYPSILIMSYPVNIDNIITTRRGIIHTKIDIISSTVDMIKHYYIYQD